ncbi:MAG: hypothetical protein VKQ33_12860 [Candidatus Sericytochromatia bacterium]|nr:hypothetical protein [Candidatus Sericytochromatia bacterium]
MSDVPVGPAEATGGPRGLALLYGVLFEPAAAFGAWGSELPLGPALGALLLVASQLALVGAKGSLASLALGFAVWVGWLLLGWLVLGSGLYVVASVLGGRGNIHGVLAGVAFSFLPLVLVGPLVTLAGWGAGGLAGAGLGMLMVLVWGGRVLHAAVVATMALGPRAASMALVGAELVLAGVPLTLYALLVATLLWCWA